VKINDLSDYKKSLLKLELIIDKEGKHIPKYINGKIIDGHINTNTALFNLFNNFRAKFKVSDNMLIDNKLNEKYYKQFIGKDITFLAYLDNKEGKYKYYDWFIIFDKYDIAGILNAFNKSVSKNKIKNFFKKVVME